MTRTTVSPPRSTSPGSLVRPPRGAQGARHAGRPDLEVLVRPPGRGAKARSTRSRSSGWPGAASGRPDASRGRPVRRGALTAGRGAAPQAVGPRKSPSMIRRSAGARRSREGEDADQHHGHDRLHDESCSHAASSGSGASATARRRGAAPEPAVLEAAVTRWRSRGRRVRAGGGARPERRLHAGDRRQGHRRGVGDGRLARRSLVAADVAADPSGLRPSWQHRRPPPLRRRGAGRAFVAPPPGGAVPCWPLDHGVEILDRPLPDDEPGGGPASARVSSTFALALLDLRTPRSGRSRSRVGRGALGPAATRPPRRERERSNTSGLRHRCFV